MLQSYEWTVKMIFISKIYVCRALVVKQLDIIWLLWIILLSRLSVNKVWSSLCCIQTARIAIVALQSLWLTQKCTRIHYPNCIYSNRTAMITRHTFYYSKHCAKCMQLCVVPSGRLAPPSGESTRQTPNVLEVEERARGPVSSCQVWWGLDIASPRGAKKV